MAHREVLNNVEWTASGTDVSGIAKDSEGRALAWFAGQFVEGKLQGTFSTANGQIGRWEWEGAIPDEIRSMP